LKKILFLFLGLTFFLNLQAEAGVCSNATDIKDCLRKLDSNLTKQQVLIDQMTTLTLTAPSGGTAVKVNPIPFKTSLYIFTTPVAFKNTEANNGASFSTTTTINENQWDWLATNDTWVEILPPHASKNVYAKITLSIKSPTHHSPCIWLRRQQLVKESIWENFGPILPLGCTSLSARSNFPGSVSIITPWWNNSLPNPIYGPHSTQRLQISAHSNWEGDPKDTIEWSLSGMHIELFEGL
jgi:hypothetical protein